MNFCFHDAATLDDSIYFDDREENVFLPDDLSESESEGDVGGWTQRRPVHYVYDAAAERTQQRIREGQSLVVDEVQLATM